MVPRICFEMKQKGRVEIGRDETGLATIVAEEERVSTQRIHYILLSFLVTFKSFPQEKIQPNQQPDQRSVPLPLSHTPRRDDQSFLKLPSIPLSGDYATMCHPLVF